MYNKHTNLLSQKFGSESIWIDSYLSESILFIIIADQSRLFSESVRLNESLMSALRRVLGARTGVGRGASRRSVSVRASSQQAPPVSGSATATVRVRMCVYVLSVHTNRHTGLESFTFLMYSILRFFTKQLIYWWRKTFASTLIILFCGIF